MKGKSRVLSRIEIIDGDRPLYRSIKSCSIFESDDYEECIAFLSWIRTKFIRFMISVNISKLTGIFSDNYFKYVPKPYKGFENGKYTDDELYEYYGLDYEERLIIDRVIRELA